MFFIFIIIIFEYYHYYCFLRGYFLFSVIHETLLVTTLPVSFLGRRSTKTKCHDAEMIDVRLAIV